MFGGLPLVHRRLAQSQIGGMMLVERFASFISLQTGSLGRVSAKNCSLGHHTLRASLDAAKQCGEAKPMNDWLTMRSLETSCDAIGAGQERASPSLHGPIRQTLSER